MSTDPKPPIPMDDGAHITAHFKWSEFACHDGTPVPQELRPRTRALCLSLEVLRAELGVPLTVLSGYRTPAYNASRPGTAKASRHLQGDAADLTAPGVTPQQMHDVILRLIHAGRMAEGGVGIYPGFVHYDIRGTVARWDERKDTREA